METKTCFIILDWKVLEVDYSQPVPEEGSHSVWILGEPFTVSRVFPTRTEAEAELQKLKDLYKYQEYAEYRFWEVMKEGTWHLSINGVLYSKSLLQALRMKYDF